MSRPDAKLTIGVDVGGTFVKCGLVRGRKLLTQRSFPTASLVTVRSLEEAIADAVSALKHRSPGPVSGVGVGVPGLVRYPEGVVRSVVNLKGTWADVPLRSNLMRKLKLPVQVDNDVNLMTLAEWICGAGEGTKNLICLTLGTGVGGGLVLDGRLYRGMNGSAGELGHIPLGEAGPRCPCGGMACLERTVGNREILQWVRDQLDRGVKSRILKLIDHDRRLLTHKIIDRACELGDPLARETWKRAGEAVGLVLAGVVNLLSPERIVVGGGIAQAGRWLFTPMRQTLSRRAMRGLKKIPIVPAKLGFSAGLMGAALLAQEATRE